VQAIGIGNIDPQFVCVKLYICLMHVCGIGVLFERGADRLFVIFYSVIMNDFIVFMMVACLLCIAPATFGKDTYSQVSGSWNLGATWNAGIPSSGDNVYVSAGTIVTIADLSIDFHVIIQPGGELRVTNDLTVLAWNYSMTNNGVLSVANTCVLDKNLVLDNYDSVYVGGAFNPGQSSTTLYAGSVIDVGAGGLESNGNMTLQSTSTLRIVGDLSIGTTSSPVTSSAGNVFVGGNFLSNNGTYSNQVGGTLVVAGSAEFRNGSSSSNVGTIDVSGLLTVQSGDLTNAIGADAGYIIARGSLCTTNGGCVKGGSLDYIGVYTNDSGCDMVGNGVTLPVELASLGAIVQHNGVLLVWETASEANNRGFRVEYSADGDGFRPIAFIDGNGTSSVGHSYECFCKDIYAGLGYYRIVQVDYDGTEKSSRVVDAFFEPARGRSLTVYKDGDVYVVSRGGADVAMLTVYDSGGAVLCRVVLGSGGASIPVDFLPAGIKIFSVDGFSLLID